MLGFEIFVFREIKKTPLSEPEQLLVAQWMTNPSGLEWIDGLVKANKAVDLGGNGYPCRYSVAAGILLPILSKGLPSNDGSPVIGDDYFLPRGWNGKLEVKHANVADCLGDEKLHIEAWDQS